MWEIAVAIGIPGIGAAYGIARYFWKKSQCFIILENKVNQLSEHDEGSTELHDGFEDRLDCIEKRQGKNEIYLKLLLRHNNIPFDE